MQTNDIVGRLPAKCLSMAFMLAIAAMMAGCARPTGDFGRAKASIVHDKLLPALGRSLASRRGEPVSDYNLTDLEKSLRDRAWALVAPMHTRDWLGGIRAETQRTRLRRPADHTIDHTKYYWFLKRDSFRSSDARYERVISDMRSDAQLVGPFYRIAWKVDTIDARRLRTVNSRNGISPYHVDNAHSRAEENLEVTRWTWRSLRKRMDAYRFAIDHLEIETPSSKLETARRTFNDLADAIERAESRIDTAVAQRVKAPRRARTTSAWGNDDIVPQK